MLREESTLKRGLKAENDLKYQELEEKMRRTSRETRDLRVQTEKLTRSTTTSC